MNAVTGNEQAPVESLVEAGPTRDVLMNFFGEVVESYDTSLTWGHPPDRRLVITVPGEVVRAMRAIRETDSNARRGAGAADRATDAREDSRDTCPHGYRLEDLRTGASVCEVCEEQDEEPKLSFEELKRTTAADLRQVARLINERAEQVAAGDMAVMDKLMEEDFQKLYEMLLLRYAHRREARDG